jgi:hypothetical protein
MLVCPPCACVLPRRTSARRSACVRRRSRHGCVRVPRAWRPGRVRGGGGYAGVAAGVLRRPRLAQPCAAPRAHRGAAPPGGAALAAARGASRHATALQPPRQLTPRFPRQTLAPRLPRHSLATAPCHARADVRHLRHGPARAAGAPLLPRNQVTKPQPLTTLSLHFRLLLPLRCLAPSRRARRRGCTLAWRWLRPGWPWVPPAATAGQVGPSRRWLSTLRACPAP